MASISERLKRLMGYGVGDFGLNIYWNSLSLILVFWYAEVVGLEPKTAGLIYFIGLIWDAISDPVVATLSERTKTRWGSYRPFVLFGSFLLAPSFCLLFWKPPLSGTALLVVLVVVNMVFRASYTLVAVPYAALSARITFDSRERSDLSGVRMTFAFSGLLAITLFWFPLSRYFGDGGADPARGFFITACIGALLATIVLVGCFVVTEENAPIGEITAPSSKGLSGFKKALSRNAALRSLLVVVFLNAGAGASLFTPMAFYLEAYSSSFAEKEVIMTLYGVTTLLSVPIWTVMTRMIGKKRVWYTATAFSTAVGFCFFVFGPIPINGIPVSLVMFAFSGGAFAVLVWAIIPDTVEYGQYVYGERAEGAIFGSTLFVQKMSGGLMGLIVGYVLSGIGYDASLEQQPLSVADNLGKFLAITPPILLILASATLFRMPLTQKEHARIVDELSS